MSRLNLSTSINRMNKLNIETTAGASNEESTPQTTVVELNVGGVYYATTLGTLLSEQESLFVHLFSTLESTSSKLKDSKNKLFFDRDGLLFRYILDFLRNKSIILPENFCEKRRLKREAEYFKLAKMVKLLDDMKEPIMENETSNPSFSNVLSLRQHLQQHSADDSTSSSGLPQLKKRTGGGTIVIGYRGTFAFGRESLSDVKFRKISRILVCGRVQLCREVFSETLNESRDPDHGVPDRYTSRFFLKHTFLEQAFDTLTDAGFFLIGTCATGTNSPSDQFNKAANDSEESRWLHYNEFIYIRP
jgi:hypothetical protein